MLMNKIKISELKKTIKTFDIVLCTTNSQFSSLINYSQQLINGRGKYTHVALCIKGSDLPIGYTFNDKNSDKSYKIDSNEIYLFESVVDTCLESKNIFDEYFDGVQLRKFDETFEKYFDLQKQGIFKEFAVAKLNVNYEINPVNIYNTINKYLGTKYNTGIIDKIYVPFRNVFFIYWLKYMKDFLYGNSHTDNGILCTTLTSHVLKDVNLIDSSVDSHAMLTEDFVYETWSSKNNNFKQIYLEPIDIIE